MSTETATAGHNSKERAKIIQTCAEQMRGIKATRKELNEDAGEIRQRLKDAGIPTEAFDAALRLADMEDIAARDTFLDGLRESAEALGIGESLDWVNFVAKAGPTEPKSLDLKAVYATGKKAGLAGKDLESNPHDDDTEAHENWAAGWRKGQDEMATQQFNSDAVAAS
jgi:ribosome modulation factor